MVVRGAWCVVSRSSSAASVCPPPFRREDPAPDSILIGRFRGGPRTTPRATSGCRGGVERRGVGGSCEIGGRVWGRLDHPPPPPSARSRLPCRKDVKLAARNVKMADSGCRKAEGVRRALHTSLKTVKHFFKKLT